MKSKDQITYIRDLSRRIAESIVEQIREGKIPEDWDGHELRALLAARSSESAQMSLVVKDRRSRRSRDFRNHILINNL